MRADEEYDLEPHVVPDALKNNPFPTVLALTVMLGVGLVSLVIAAEGERLWSVVGLFAIGIAFLASSLLIANDFGRALLIDRYGSELPSIVVLFFTLTAAVGIGFAALGIGIESSVLAAVGVVLIAVGAIGIYVWLAVRAIDSKALAPEPADPQSLLWSKSAKAVWVGLELVALGSGLIWITNGFGGVAFAAVIAWLIGLMVVKGGVVSLLKASAHKIKRVLRMLIDVTALGLIILVGGATASSEPLVLVGFSVVVLGLSVLGLALMFVKLVDGQAMTVMLVGLLGVLVGILWTIGVVNGDGLGLVLSLFVVAVGAWFVFRGEGIVLILLVGSVVVWGLESNTSSAPIDPNPEAPARIVSLGDSFISGEGASQYLAGTNIVGDNRNECRRAPTAYSYLLAERLEMGLDFYACSGAKSRHVIGETETAAQMPDSPDDIPGNRAQIENIRPGDLDTGDVVLLSIGGNDVGFSDIVQACLLPRSCDERSGIWLSNVDAVGSELKRTYERIKEVVPIDVPIIVVPYPLMVTEEQCDLGLDGAEHTFVLAFIRMLDAEIEQATAEAGVHYFKAAETVFDGHRLCESGAAANHLQLSAPEGDRLGRFQPGSWIHNSMHPNEDGHELLAAALQPFVEEKLGAAAPGESANPPPAAGSGTDPLEGIEEDAQEAEELLTDGAWIKTELYRTLRALMLPMLLLMVSGIAFATGFVNQRWWIARMFRPTDTWRDLPVE